MSKFIKFAWSAVLVASLFVLGILLADKLWLRENVIRLRVVAHSDESEDQKNKLLVRDAITEYLETKMQSVSNASAAKNYLVGQLDALEEIATAVLRAQGSRESVKVYLTEENADTRVYDTFRLPSGVYKTLRIDIGEAQGKNWWCVVFPSLCIPATTDGFQAAAVGAGFDAGLTESLSETDGFEIRFFLLDCLGKLEEFLFPA
ncbi:MAG: stage II sporulation protein R [Oscillospiraceae bacterium]|nr:stage II sporulation protein R [Oscillospiraceae bacterium]